MKLTKTILYNLKLHESINTSGNTYLITRVIGGFIYCRQEPSVNIANPVFIPLYPDSLI